MGRYQDNNVRRRHDPFDADGGRRFDEYVHTEEFPNPLETAARLRKEKKERYKKFCNAWVWVEIVFFVFLLAILGLVVTYHQKLHSKNECAMTYIYRPMIFNPIPVLGNKVEKYSLIRYHEGYRDETVFDIDIPVLFVPGSSGSAKQVRSLATTIMNKTAELGDKFKYRFVFFACDFDEEFSFLSGATLIRQREFVVKSIETILKFYAATGVKKLLLMGHSFGGTILHSLPAHSRADPKWMDLVITLGAPINAPPFKSDYYMEMFYENTMKAWNTRTEELSHVTLISYSGGIKDFMYTKDMKVIAGTRDSRVLYRPSWSLRDVATDVDHNCLAWCNQLIKHISAMVIKYGMEWKMPKAGAMKASRQVLKEFYQERIGAEKRGPAKKDPLPLFNNSIYIQEEKRMVKITEDNPYVKIDMDLRQFDIVVYIRARATTCSTEITASHADLTFRSSENFTSYSIQEGAWMYMRVFPVFPETENLKGFVKIGGTPGCEYEVEANFEVIGTVYRRVMDSTSLPFVVFYTLVFFAMIPVFSIIKLPPPFDYIYRDLPEWFYTGLFLCAFALFGGMAISSRYSVERNFLTILMWGGGARLSTVLICLLAQPIIRFVSRRLISRCSLQVRATCRVVLSFLSVTLASSNVTLGYAAFLFINLFKVGTHSRTGTALIAYSISILVSIGLAGNVRDGPAGVFQGTIFDVNPTGYFEALVNIFFMNSHPLLFSFFTLSFCTLMNFSHMLRPLSPENKEKFIGIFYAMFCLSLYRVTNLESMAVVTTYYILLFEILKDQKGLRSGDGKNVD